MKLTQKTDFLRVFSSDGYSSGYSLVELLVAVAISGIVMGLVGTGIFQLMQSRNSLGFRTARQSDQKNFSAKFVPMVENAGISLQFQHLPIPVFCPAPAVAGNPPDKPCLTVGPPSATVPAPGFGPYLPATATAAQIKAAGFQEGHLEFFRDEHAGLSTHNPVSPLEEPANFSRYQIGMPVGVPAIDAYLTWPLIDETSPPFLMMATTNSAYQYQMQLSQVTDPGAGGYGTRDILFDGRGFPNLAAATAEAVNLQGRLFVLYDQETPTRFVIQRATNAVAQSYAAGVAVFRFTFDAVDGAAGGFLEGTHYPPLANILNITAALPAVVPAPPVTIPVTPPYPARMPDAAANYVWGGAPDAASALAGVPIPISIDSVGTLGATRLSDPICVSKQGVGGRFYPFPSSQMSFMQMRVTVSGTEVSSPPVGPPTSVTSTTACSTNFQRVPINVREAAWDIFNYKGRPANGQPVIAAMPIEVRVFYLTANPEGPSGLPLKFTGCPAVSVTQAFKIPPGCPRLRTYSLKMLRFPGLPRDAITVLDAVTDKLILARKLGTHSVSIYQVPKLCSEILAGAPKAIGVGAPDCL